MTTTATPDADYAFWTIPDTSFKIVYSLVAFREIDFIVNEGYRRIPHGGIEIGGLLFGRVMEDGVRIENFRLIECEHASGPSFNLSEKDISNLEQQILSAVSDPELNGLEAMGWFIAHTRGALKLTEKEKLLFDRFFPSPNRLTALIKPERFHPTRIGFLIRDQMGQMSTDATSTAIILPSHGSQNREGPVPSIAAPPENPATRPLDRTLTEINDKPVPRMEEPQPVDEPARLSEFEVRAATSEYPTPHKEIPPAKSPLPPEPAASKSFQTEMPPPLTATPRRAPGIEPSRTRQRQAADTDLRRAHGIQFILVLLVAALLGCFVGYWAYLQLPSSVISLAVSRQENTLLISWSPAQTRTSAYATIRVNGGDPVMLSTAEKIAGHTAISNSGNDVKIELIAQHWLRDSHGLIRFVDGSQNSSSGVSPVSNIQPASSGSARSQLP